MDELNNMNEQIPETEETVVSETEYVSEEVVEQEVVAVNSFEPVEIEEGAYGDDYIKEAPKKGKKKIIIISSIVAAALILVAVLAIFLPGWLTTTEDLLAEGNYIEAYEKAENASEKDMVIHENIAAFASYEISEGLKDPDSFELKQVYWTESGLYAFTISGNNSYGTPVTNYYLYSYDKEEQVFERLVYLSDLEEETVYSWDDEDDEIDKLIHNIGIQLYMDARDNGESLESASIDRINTLFQNDELGSVTLIKEAKDYFENLA